ncbi:MAG TPA: type II secretion system F family protein [Burkholderiaceae bacterium]|jgi:MSHA biogenesis protein MshG|nr:type II secretion system F family protein [Burkholderiaceae bacterium]
MPLFAYVARDSGGARIEGRLEAANPTSLADALAAQGSMLVRADVCVDSDEGLGAFFDRRFGGRIQIDDLLMFCRQLATLMKAGVPLLRSLQGLYESATKARFAELLERLRQQLEAGRQLSAAMQREEPVFSRYMVSMVRVGEVTGRMYEIFMGLHAQLSFERENREQVRSALRYPIFVLCAATVALVVLNIFVIPAFAKVYKGLHTELPLITQLLIAVSDFFVHSWPVLVVAVVAAVGGLGWGLRTQAGRRMRDELLLRLPIFGTLVRKAALARFTKSFGLALEAGIPVVDALQVAVETAGNIVLSERIGQMKTSAERGETLAKGARATGVFTPTILQMIAVGEETGALGEMMNEVAEYYRKDVEYAVRGLAAQIEPIMIVLMGCMVLVVALGVFLPMWDLSRAVIHHN